MRLECLIKALSYRIPNSMTEESLNLYFRAFMIKLSAMESQLGEFASAGQSPLFSIAPVSVYA